MKSNWIQTKMLQTASFFRVFNKSKRWKVRHEKKGWFKTQGSSTKFTSKNRDISMLKLVETVIENNMDFEKRLSKRLYAYHETSVLPTVGFSHFIFGIWRNRKNFWKINIWKLILFFNLANFIKSTWTVGNTLKL